MVRAGDICVAPNNGHTSRRLARLLWADIVEKLEKWMQSKSRAVCVDTARRQSDA